MKINGNQYKSVKINENQCKSLKIIENLWKSCKNIQNHWKSMKIHDGIQYQISRKSKPNFPIQVLLWILKWKLLFWATCEAPDSSWQPQWKSLKIYGNHWKSQKLAPKRFPPELALKGLNWPWKGSNGIKIFYILTKTGPEKVNRISKYELVPEKENRVSKCKIEPAKVNWSRNYKIESAKVNWFSKYKIESATVNPISK